MRADLGLSGLAPVGMVFRFRDEKIVHGKVFASPQEALAAAGLAT